MPLILDTGFIYALADLDDAWHERARDYLDEVREVLFVPASVVPEVACLLRERLGAREERAFILSLANHEMEVEGLTIADFERIAALTRRYREIGFVDASVVAIAERLGLRAIATTDRRHFAPIRPVHVPAFELVP